MSSLDKASFILGNELWKNVLSLYWLKRISYMRGENLGYKYWLKYRRRGGKRIYPRSFTTPHDCGIVNCRGYILYVLYAPRRLYFNQFVAQLA